MSEGVWEKIEVETMKGVLVNGEKKQRWLRIAERLLVSHIQSRPGRIRYKHRFIDEEV